MLNNDKYYLFGWGKNYKDITNIDKDIIAMGVGENHMVYITNSNQMYGFGSNKFGQLGIQTPNSLQKPEKILEKFKFKNVFCGAEHTFFINQKHQIYSAGLNIKGQLGLNTFENQKQPKIVVSLLPYGKKNPKSLNSNLLKQPKPQIVEILEKFDLQVKMDDDSLQNVLLLDHDEFIENISCGSLFTIALSNKGKVFGCGYQCTITNNSSNEQYMQKSKFKEIIFDAKIIEINCGLSGAAAITKDSHVFIWGKFGKLVNNIPKKIKRASYSINDKPQDEKYIKAKVGDEFVLLLTTKGQIYSFGQNIDNQLGVETQSLQYRQTPQKISSLPFCRDIFIGRNSCFAISLQNNAIYGWGSNRHQQISPLQDDPIIMIPTKLSLIIDQKDRVCASSYSTFILTKNNKLHQLQLKSVSKKLPEQQQMIKISEYRKLLKDYQILKSLNLALLEKSQPSQKQNQEAQTSSKFQVSGITKHRQFNTNLQIQWKQLSIQNQINEGGYGIIYKAKWRETTVAVKKFKIQNGDVSIRDFLSQCHAMEAVRHPNIVMFLGAVIKNPNYSIILEYCSKGSLWSYLQNSEIQLPWQQRRRIAIQIAQGVLYLHLCNPPILHRDLKSLNIFLDHHYTIKIGDFGWTKTLQQYMTNKIGTYQWMAPQVIGNKPYTQKCDVFSYSIILWEIASRQPPYRNISGAKVSEGVLNSDLRPVIPKKTPQPYSKLMKRCWDTDPARRPNFRQIIKELQIMKL